MKYTIEQVRKVFEDRGFKLLSTEYVNCKSKLRYMCPNNHIRETTFDTFKNKNINCLYGCLHVQVSKSTQ